jgi:hypothetical protein
MQTSYFMSVLNRHQIVKIQYKIPINYSNGIIKISRHLCRFVMLYMPVLSRHCPPGGDHFSTGLGTYPVRTRTEVERHVTELLQLNKACFHHIRWFVQSYGRNASPLLASSSPLPPELVYSLLRQRDIGLGAVTPSVCRSNLSIKVIIIFV